MVTPDLKQRNTVIDLRAFPKPSTSLAAAPTLQAAED
jgi:hypothetical protein